MEVGAEKINRAISRALEEKRGLLVGRFGTVECEVAYRFQMTKNTTVSKVLERNAGVFPCSEESQRSWSNWYMESMRGADILATGWYAPTQEKEQSLLHKVGWKGEEVALRSLEPYYVVPEKRWTQNLKGQNVCVVTSFAQTAAEQVKKGGAEIWGLEQAESLWPSTIKWSFVQTGYSPILAKGRATWSEAAGECIENWQEAVEYCVREVLKTEARIVILGCGGIGMIIAKELKDCGKICLVLGGATQVFLGIRGRRWAKHDVIGKLWRESWVWPLESETPAGAEEVEGGCYWKG